MGAPKTVSRDEVRRLYGEGLSDRKIAEALDCSHVTVMTIRRELKLPAHRMKWREFTEAELKKLRKLSLAGLSYGEIGRRLGRAESSCRIKLIELAILDEIAETGEGELRRKKNGIPYLHDNEGQS